MWLIVWVISVQAVSTDFTITPLAGLFKLDPLSTPWGAYTQHAANYGASWVKHSQLPSLPVAKYLQDECSITSHERLRFVII